MAIQSLTALNALSSGCDLWIVADSEHSKWTRKIDWYLNFQFQKAEAHRSPQLSSELMKVIEACDWESSRYETAIALPTPAPVMIASANLLPNTQTVLIPLLNVDSAHDVGSRLQGWVESCQKIWQGLKKPTTRIFLPDLVRAEDFDRIWAKKDRGVAHIEIVSGQELLSD